MDWGRPLLAAALIAAPLAAVGAPPVGVDLNGAIHQWFERQHNMRGDWCCNLSDGHVLTDSEWRVVGAAYQVRIDGKWFGIAMDALRHSAGGPNPTGGAVVWYVSNSAGVTIFCFAPGELY